MLVKKNTLCYNLICENIFFGGAVMIFLFLADGFEETEALVTLDLMRRAQIDVKTVGKPQVRGAHNITVASDIDISQAAKVKCDGVVLPGGMPGTNNLYADEFVRATVRSCASSGKMVAAICAAPLILGRMGILENKKAVCFPGFESELHGAVLCNSPAQTDGNIITAKGAGAVFDFAHAVISFLKDKSLADKILDDIQFPGKVG